MSKNWLFLLALSAVLAALLKLINIPAALMLGAMFAAIVLSVNGFEAKVHRWAFRIAQGMIGSMIAAKIPLTFLDELQNSWLMFLLGVTSAVIGAAFIGWVLAKKQVLPGTTAVWGMSPGAATGMTIMSEEFGADMRLVAFMQYTRVVFMAFLASLISWLYIADKGIPLPQTIWFPEINWYNLTLTFAVIICSSILTIRFKIPGGSLLLPLVFGLVLQAFTSYRLEVPYWLLAIGYTTIGWSIGLRFTKPVLKYAYKVFPKVMLAIICLLLICAGVAILLVYFADIDPLTAYLATSPGGIDSVAIIAMSSPVDMPFIMAMQACRLVLVVTLSPALARFISKNLNKNEC